MLAPIAYNRIKAFYWELGVLCFRVISLQLIKINCTDKAFHAAINNHTLYIIAWLRSLV